MRSHWLLVIPYFLFLSCEPPNVEHTPVPIAYTTLAPTPTGEQGTTPLGTPTLPGTEADTQTPHVTPTFPIATASPTGSPAVTDPEYSATPGTTASPSTTPSSHQTPTPTDIPTPTKPTDMDGDGVPASADCNDADAAIYPGAEERCDGVNNDCDAFTDEGVQETFYLDDDADGFGLEDNAVQACDVPEGYAEQPGDCNDDSAQYYPGADELDCDDPNDYNCDGSTAYEDSDGDGFPACQECDDKNSAVYPGAPETCNRIDEDCDGATDEGVTNTYYVDADSDGYGEEGTADVKHACVRVPGYAENNLDCNDDAPNTYPGAEELCDTVDNDCDGESDEDYDLDGDGFFDEDTCRFLGTDCDDSDPEVNPGAIEKCNGLDDNCSGAVDEGFDVDEDGYTSCGGDCDDTETGVHPGAIETCNGRDDDCGSDVDEGLPKSLRLDGSGWFAADGDFDRFYFSDEVEVRADVYLTGVDVDLVFSLPAGIAWADYFATWFNEGSYCGLVTEGQSTNVNEWARFQSCITGVEAGAWHSVRFHWSNSTQTLSLDLDGESLSQVAGQYVEPQFSYEKPPLIGADMTGDDISTAGLLNGEIASLQVLVDGATQLSFTGYPAELDGWTPSGEFQFVCPSEGGP